MLPERDRQDDCVGLECIPQRLGDDRGSNRPSLRRQRLGRPAARDGHIDVFTGEGMSEGLAYLPESYKDRKSTRLNSSHTVISYAVFCLKKKKKRYIVNH